VVRLAGRKLQPSPSAHNRCHKSNAREIETDGRMDRMLSWGRLSQKGKILGLKGRVAAQSATRPYTTRQEVMKKLQSGRKQT